ncbi:UDP-N-acetylmuramate dehydrogenase [Candidatus Kaiserbacteria bacterium]|nr:UDP-N-acetylmuramate dehydrogenase [Candidatus Kaiserbacteria bacterium]MCB9811695.1 UDP-N-acetylmuramate dehydrogenase [Candidatus Nomurabacteria bacterium]
MITILPAEPLHRHTTLNVGGEAEYFVAVKDKTEAVSAVTTALEKNLPITILGGGSNVLVSDSGIKGLVIKNKITGITSEQSGDNILVTAGAGEVFDDLIAHTVAKGWWGLENLSHIPGTVGATPVQNVGAYGVEIADVLVSLTAIDTRTGEERVFSAPECEFWYRRSFFKSALGRHYFITSVTFKVQSEANPQIAYRDLERYFKDQTDYDLEHIRAAVIDIRSTKFPDWSVLGTAGSFFQNPIVSPTVYTELKSRYPELPGYEQTDGVVKLPLGWILDKIVGLKGLRVGNVGMYENQALVLVNYGGATAAEITAFAESIQEKVAAATGIEIEWEVTKL